MNALWKRYSWNLILICNVFLITLFFLKITTKLENIYVLANQSTTATSDTAIHFIIDTYEQINFSFLKEEKKSFALLEKGSDVLPLFKVVYANNYFNIESGTDFTPEAFFARKPVALRGSKATEIFEVEPFKVNYRTYDMLGVLLNEKTFASQYAAYYTNGNADRYIRVSEFILEGFSKREMERIYAVIEREIKSQKYPITPIDIKATKLGNYYDINEMSLNINLLILLVNFSTILLLIYFWLEQYGELYHVYFVFGLKNFIRKIYFNFIFLITTGVGLAILVERNQSVLSWGVIYFLLLIFMTIVLFGSLIKKKNGDWNEKSLWGNNL